MNLLVLRNDTVIQVVSPPPVVVQVTKPPESALRLVATPVGVIPYPSITHVQDEPLATWLINHPMPYKPSVDLIIDGRVEYADITHPSLGLVAIGWPTPTAGEAVLR